MSIKPVYRVQCSGPCKGWLSPPDDHPIGADIYHDQLVVKPTAEHAGLWPTWDAAYRAAGGAGWVDGVDGRYARCTCGALGRHDHDPECRKNNPRVDPMCPPCRKKAEKNRGGG